MNADAYLKKKLRQRRRFAVTGLLLYFSLVVHYLLPEGVTAGFLPGTGVPVPIALYAGTIVLFLLLEVLFLWRARRLVPPMRD